MLSSKSTPASVYQALWKSIKAQRVWRGKLVNHGKTGEEYLAELTISPVLNPGGRVSYYLGMHRDITELQPLFKLVQQIVSERSGIEQRIRTYMLSL